MRNAIDDDDDDTLNAGQKQIVITAAAHTARCNNILERVARDSRRTIWSISRWKTPGAVMEE